jgi:hypothetical protein
MKLKSRIKELKETIYLMFNVKMLSLMKKQLFSLVMMLAFVFAGTIVFAQNTGLSPTDPIWHLPGSTHGLQVANHTGTSYTWNIYGSNCSGVSTGAAVGASITSGSYQATITYTAAASGMYLVECVEASTGDNLCSTRRQFWTAIMNIDVIVTASNATGTELTGGALSTCNDYSTLHGSNLVGNANTDDNTNDLNGWITNTLYNERYVHVALTVADLSGCTGMTGAPAASAFAWQFTYTIAGTNYISPSNFIGMQAVTGVTNATPTAATGTISVAATTTTFTIPLRSYIRWGLTNTDQDQDFTFTVDSGSTVLDGSDGDVLYDDGTEPAANNGNNQSASQHIDASPATPRIVVND